MSNKELVDALIKLTERDKISWKCLIFPGYSTTLKGKLILITAPAVLSKGSVKINHNNVGSVDQEQLRLLVKKIQEKMERKKKRQLKEDSNAVIKAASES